MQDAEKHLTLSYILMQAKQASHTRTKKLSVLCNNKNESIAMVSYMCSGGIKRSWIQSHAGEKPSESMGWGSWWPFKGLQNWFLRPSVTFFWGRCYFPGHTNSEPPHMVSRKREDWMNPVIPVLFDCSVKVKRQFRVCIMDVKRIRTRSYFHMEYVCANMKCASIWSSIVVSNTLPALEIKPRYYLLWPRHPLWAESFWHQIILF